MILDKPSWASHEGPILSIHSQPNGQRFATGGMDIKVKLWSLPVALDAQRELQERQAGKGDPRPLAVLLDHTAPVNVVRFSHGNKLLASGSDDKMVCIFEHRAGPGAASLGMSGPSAENWRNKLVLRGHHNNVVDLGWSADDSRLATASIDNSVMVWDAATGALIRRLELHTSFVKGVAWDPVGTYLASQSEDKSVAIWRVDDWSVVATVRGPYSQMVSATFANRLSWSPDGQLLLTGNSYQGATHAAVVIQREKWGSGRDHLLISGHQGAVVATAFNPHMFRLGGGGGSCSGRQQPGAAAAADGEDAQLTTLFALGSQDHGVTVWKSNQCRPLVCGKKLFKAQVVDVAWTPDGYGLLACSSDGSVAVMQFEEGELGRTATSEEQQEVLQQLYGAGRGQAGQRRVIAESAEQLMLEEQEVAAVTLPPALQAAAAADAAPTAAAAAAGQAGSLKRAPEQPLQPSGKLNTLDAAAALDARLSGRMGRAAGETQLGFGPQGASGGLAGKKRVAAELISAGTGPVAPAQLMPPPPARAPASGRAAAGGADGKRVRLEPTPAAPAGTAPAPAAAGGGSAATAEQAAADTPRAAVTPGAILLRRPDIPVELTVHLATLPSLFDAASTCGGAVAAAGAGAGAQRELRVVNRERGLGGRAQADLQCSEGSSVKWSDSVRGVAVAVCGTANFAAVGLADGQLLVYSRAGRRLTAPVKLGAGIARLACDDAWRLLAITTSGSVRLLDVEPLRTVLTASLAPLLEGGASVLDARLSRTGLPLITLSNAQAYAWSSDLEAWLCLADDSCAASQFAPMLRLASQGELSSLQAQALRTALPWSGAGAAALMPGSPAQQRQLSRAHLEANLAGALALQSPQEYRRWLVTYIRFLTEQCDHDRLSEVCDSLLGVDLPSSTELQAPHEAAAAAAAGGGSSEGGLCWQPTVLGLDKRTLLRGEVLREVARNRQLSWLFSKYKDAVDEILHPPAALPALEGVA